MGADEIADWLQAIGILAAEVAVGVERDRAWCVRPVPPEPDGDGGVADGAPGADGAGGLDGAGGVDGAGGAWEVFWSEDGGRFEWTRFDDEETACLSLFGRLTWVEVLRGRRFG